MDGNQTEIDLDRADAHRYPVRERETCYAADALRRSPRAIVTDAAERAKAPRRCAFCERPSHGTLSVCEAHDKGPAKHRPHNPRPPRYLP